MVRTPLKNSVVRCSTGAVPEVDNQGGDSFIVVECFSRLLVFVISGQTYSKVIGSIG